MAVCVICNRQITDDDVQAHDVEVITKELPFPFGRFVKTGRIIEGKEEVELRLFHEGTEYHVSCYYNHKYRLD